MPGAPGEIYLDFYRFWSLPGGFRVEPAFIWLRSLATSPDLLAARSLYQCHLGRRAPGGGRWP